MHRCHLPAVTSLQLQVLKFTLTAGDFPPSNTLAFGIELSVRPNSIIDGGIRWHFDAALVE